ncbi:MAG: CPBP family intramembrane metalloprotease [Aeromicrobium sp.]|uniref:CPBP family intramembrane glutamic endopeptidase n=1 Tax=Aeromicrobium sp. TaxID=1871063 RepID=UPI0039E6DD6F
MTERSRTKAEVWIVLGLSLGQSAVYAVLSLIVKLTDGGLKSSTATLNASRAEQQWLDLTLQVLSIGFGLVPVALALWLLAGRSIGLDPRSPGRDTLIGAGLAALIGLPGLGVYFAGRALGVTAEIVTAPDTVYWWTALILVAAALQNGLLEEVVVVGYLQTRLRDLGWNVGTVIVTSALLRGSYHLYQGVGQAFGNVVMGLVFGWWFHKTGRVMPLVVAHTLLDVVAFVGYLALADQVAWL